MAHNRAAFSNGVRRTSRKDTQAKLSLTIRDSGLLCTATSLAPQVAAGYEIVTRFADVKSIYLRYFWRSFSMPGGYCLGQESR
jgi:hypothetical protein